MIDKKINRKAYDSIIHNNIIYFILVENSKRL